MKRQAHPIISPAGDAALTRYAQVLREQEDLTVTSVRNYLSDVRLFLFWHGTRELPPCDENPPISSFDPQAITTPPLTHYRTFLQILQKQKPVLVNRTLVSLKRYFGWAHHMSPHDLRHHFDYGMAESVPLHRLAQIMGHDSLDTTKISIQGTKQDLQQAVEITAWNEKRKERMYR